MGSLIAGAQRRAPRHGRSTQLAYGALVAIGGTLGALSAGRLAKRVIERLPAPLNGLTEGAVLKMTFSVGRLNTVARQIETTLSAPEQDLAEARRLVSWHLVSRDTSQLDSSQVAAATIESVAESASDGIMAPLLAYAAFGLPGALAYRFVNTADSMLGYRDAAREWLGKIPARMDDALNVIPARMTAFLLTLGAGLVGESARNAWRTWRRDSGKTASPNAGHPMSAMAGALEIELEKVDHYILGQGHRPPRTGDIGRAVRVMQAAVGLGIPLLTGLILIARRLSQK
jgi:adenosylcobinamide-phosphate synthase